MTTPFDPHEMLVRFQRRAEAVKRRGVPPIEGEDRKRFIENAQLDFLDYSLLADGNAEIVDGLLTITVRLTPVEEESPETPHPG